MNLQQILVIAISTHGILSTTHHIYDKGSHLKENLKANDIVIVTDKVFRDLNSTISMVPGTHSKQLIVVDHETGYYCYTSTLKATIYLRKHLLGRRMKSTHYPYITNMMNGHQFDLLLSHCEMKKIIFKIDQRHNILNLPWTVISFDAHGLLFINRNCLSDYLAQSLKSQGKTELFYSIDKELTESQALSVLSICKDESLEHQEEVSVTGSFTLNVDSDDSYIIDMVCKSYITQLKDQDLSILPRYFFYFMYAHDYLRLTNWCKGAGISPSRGEQLTIFINGRLGEIGITCYGAHVEQVKRNRMAVIGLNKNLDVQIKEHKHILRLWCQDFDLPTSTCPIYYEATLNKWLDRNAVSRNTYDFMLKACEQLKLNDEDDIQIQVHHDNEDKARPLELSKKCFISFNYFKFGQFPKVDSDLYTNFRVLLGKEIANLHVLAQYTGPQVVLKKLVKALTKSEIREAICAYLMNCPNFED